MDMTTESTGTAARRAVRRGLLLLLLLTLLSLTACVQGHDLEEPFYLGTTEAGLLYEDHVNGCVLTLPTGAEADTSMFPVRTVFSAEGWKLQVFVATDLSSSKQREYIGYSNKPLENDGELTRTESGTRSVGPKEQ